MISDVKDSQQTQATGGSDPVSSAAEEARRAAEQAAEAARKAAEAAAAAAQARDAQKAQELQAQAAKFAEAAAKAAQKAAAAAERLATTVQKLAGKGKPTARQTELLQKARASAGAAMGSSLAAVASSAKAASAVKQLQARGKPADTFVRASGPQLTSGPKLFPPPFELNPKPPKPFGPPQPPKAPELPKLLTPQDKLEAAREQRLEQSERSAAVNKLPGVPVGPEGVGVDITAKATIAGKNYEINNTELYSSRITETTQPGDLSKVATFQVSHEFGTARSEPNQFGKVSGKVAVTDGQALRYTFSIPADKAEPYRSQGRVPDLTDPRSLPVGSSALINEEQLHGSAGELNLEVLKFEGGTPLKAGKLDFGKPGVSGGPRLEASSSTVSGRSTLVERVSDNQVRLTSGPTEGVKGQMAAGFYVGESTYGLFEAGGKVGTSRSLTGGEYKSVTVNLDEPAGKAVYQHFLATGQLPPVSGKVVANQATVYESHYSTSVDAEAGLKLMGLSMKTGGTLASYGVDQRTVVKGDGSMTTSATVNNSNRTLQLDKSFDPNGQPVSGSLQGHYLLHQTEAETARMLQDSFTPKSDLVDPAAGTQDAQLSLSEPEALQLRDIARQYCDQTKGYPDAWKDGADRDIPIMVTALASAETPDEVHYALIETGASNNNLYDLRKLREFNNAPLPGTVEVRANP